MEFKILILIFLAFFLNVNSVAAEENSTTEEPPISPCPCTDQAEGTVIPHPSDCRAYYTCLSGNNVRLSKCGHVDNFFHPYVRSCVQRSTFVSFVPDFIPTKDLCKISAVFPAPAMEDFGNCSIKYDETTTSLDSDESVSGSGSVNVTANPTSTTTATTILPGLNKILSLFPWTMENQRTATTSSPPTNILSPTTPSMMDLITGRASSMQNSIDNLMHSNNPRSISSTSCKVAKIIVHHFPGPCKTDITCEGGVKFTIDKCQNSLSLVSL